VASATRGAAAAALPWTTAARATRDVLTTNAATLLLLDNTVSPIGAMDARTVCAPATPTRRGGPGRGLSRRLGFALNLIRLARTRRVRRVRNAVASTELRPRHLRAATAIEAGVPNKANTRGLSVQRAVTVVQDALLKDCAARALLARMNEAARTEIGAARPMLTGMGRVQLGVVEVLHLGTSPLIRKRNHIRGWGCIGHLRIKNGQRGSIFF